MRPKTFGGYVVLGVMVLLLPLFAVVEWIRRFRWYKCPNCHGYNGRHSGMDVCPPDPEWIRARRR